MQPWKSTQGLTTKAALVFDRPPDESFAQLCENGVTHKETNCCLLLKKQILSIPIASPFRPNILYSILRPKHCRQLSAQHIITPPVYMSLLHHSTDFLSHLQRFINTKITSKYHHQKSPESLPIGGPWGTF
jgi:hypothetical protein